MSLSSPHFVLLADARRRNQQDEWRFVLKAADGSATLEAHETEPAVQGERLELLSVVRGLEALDQPSRVTLVTPSRYVRRGITDGLDEWRRNDWTWESFGEMIPVKNRDLWQRLDRAMNFHRVDVRTWRIDPAHGSSSSTDSDDRPATADTTSDSENVRQAFLPAKRDDPSGQTDPDERTEMSAPRQASRPARRRSLARRVRWIETRIARWFAVQFDRSKTLITQLGTDWFPPPWLD